MRGVKSVMHDCHALCTRQNTQMLGKGTPGLSLTAFASLVATQSYVRLSTVQRVTALFKLFSTLAKSRSGDNDAVISVYPMR